MSGASVMPLWVTTATAGDKHVMKTHTCLLCDCNVCSNLEVRESTQTKTGQPRQATCQFCTTKHVMCWEHIAHGITHSIGTSSHTSQAPMHILMYLIVTAVAYLPHTRSPCRRVAIPPQAAHQQDKACNRHPYLPRQHLTARVWRL